MVSVRWVVGEADETRQKELAKALRCTPLFARLLVSRGIADPESALRFLDPKLLHLRDPLELPDMERAVERIAAALARGESIVVFGDYDADGISSTCLLLEFFKLIGRPVRYRLPHRLKEGYGLRAETVDELAARGANLLITVDNGSSSAEEIARAAAYGIETVIVDHHRPSSHLPPAAAHVNPWLAAQKLQTELAGVGVTYKLVWALARRLSRARKLAPEFREFLLHSLALVALGTIADVVPLHGENRILARFGLLYLARTKRPGLRLLCEAALQGRLEERIRARDVGFGLGPRINAVGRLGRAELALELLQTDDEGEAKRLVALLERENARRRAIEKRIYEDARNMVRESVDLASARAIVLSSPEWHPGVVGIVASRIAEEFRRPAILLVEKGGICRGSARSIPEVHITEALEKVAHHLKEFGGHSLAAGVECRVEELDAFRDALNLAIDVDVTALTPQIAADCRASLEEIAPPFLEELRRLMPFGEGNPEPLFASREVEVVGRPRLLGREGRHLAFFVREKGRAYRAVAFGMGEEYERVASRGGVRLLFRPRWNEWQGRREIELEVRGIERT